MKIAILGGTGTEGRALAQRWARGNHQIFIGSRELKRAQTVAAVIAERAKGQVIGVTNEQAATSAEVVVLAVPYAGHRTLVEAVRNRLAGKVVIDTVVPLDFSAPHPYAPPEQGSAAEQAQDVLGPDAKVVAALHHIAAHDLEQEGADLERDALLAGNDQDAKAIVNALIGELGARPIDVGALRFASVLEAMTVVLIQINRRYKTKSAGIRIKM